MMNGPVSGIVGVIVAAVLGSLVPAAGEPSVHWTSVSTAGNAVTGDISVSASAITFGNGVRLPIAKIGEAQGRWTPLGISTGQIFKITPPRDPVLLNGNKLCGMPDPVTYIVLSKTSGGRLGLSVFYGPKPPRGFGDHSCAAYFYER